MHVYKVTFLNTVSPRHVFLKNEISLNQNKNYCVERQQDSVLTREKVTLFSSLLSDVRSSGMHTPVCIKGVIT